MKQLILILSIIIFAGCRTTHEISEHTRTEYKDTTIFIQLPVDTITKRDTVFIDNNNLVQMDTVTAENDYTTAIAFVFNSELSLQLFNKKAEIPVETKNKIVSTEKTDITKTVKKEMPFWGYIVFSVLLLSILLLIIKK